MSTSPWKRLPDSIPEDEATVWVRLRPWGPAFRASWDLASQTFTHSSTLTVPWFEVAKWKEDV